eukprot:13489235-Ditylum_brightwellii.AAC.1
MAECSEEVMGTEPALAPEATEAHIHDAQDKIVQLHEEVMQLNSCCTTLSAMCTGVTLVQLFESKFIELDSALAGHTIATPFCGGIFKDKNQDKELIIFWSSSDPDSKVNCFSWSKDDSKLQIPRSQYLPGVESMKSQCHICMLWPTIPKHAKVVQDACVAYKGTTFNGLSKSDKVCPLMTICQHKATVFQHMINNMMCNILIFWIHRQ